VIKVKVIANRSFLGPIGSDRIIDEALATEWMAKGFVESVGNQQEEEETTENQPITGGKNNGIDERSDFTGEEPEAD